MQVEAGIDEQRNCCGNKNHLPSIRLKKLSVFLRDLEAVRLSGNIFIKDINCFQSLS